MSYCRSFGLLYPYDIHCVSTKFDCPFRFNNIRVPRENLLNLVADVLPDGKYVSMIDNPDQVPDPTYPPFLSLSHTYSEKRGELSTDLHSLLRSFYSYFQINKVSYLQRFAAFLSPLTLGRVNIAVNAVYISKVCWVAFPFR